MSKKTTASTTFTDSKAYKAFGKIFGFAECQEFYARAEDDLKDALSACAMQIAEATTEMEENPKYRQAKEICNDFRKGLAEVSKPLKAKINAAAEILNYKKDTFRRHVTGVHVDGNNTTIDITMPEEDESDA